MCPSKMMWRWPLKTTISTTWAIAPPNLLPCMILQFPPHFCCILLHFALKDNVWVKSMVAESNSSCRNVPLREPAKSQWLLALPALKTWNGYVNAIVCLVPKIHDIHRARCVAAVLCKKQQWKDILMKSFLDKIVSWWSHSSMKPFFSEAVPWWINPLMN